jgi:hypothetical protein
MYPTVFIGEIPISSITSETPSHRGFTLPKASVDDLWIYIYQHGPVRTRDLEQAFVATRQMARATLYRYKQQLLTEGKVQAQSVPGRPPYNLYSVPSYHHTAIELLQHGTAFSLMNIQRLDDVPWEDAPRDVFVTDVKQKVLWRNDATGATFILLKSPASAGITDRRHFHPEANQWSFGLAGEAIDEHGKWTFLGSVGYNPRGQPHGPSTVTKDALCFVFWDGPRTSIIVKDGTVYNKTK